MSTERILQPIVEQYHCSLITIVQGDQEVSHAFSAATTMGEQLSQHGIAPLLKLMQEIDCTELVLSDDLIRLRLERRGSSYVMAQFFEGGRRVYREFEWTESVSQPRPSWIDSNKPIASKAPAQVPQQVDGIGQRFCQAHGVQIPYVAGAMAGGIASVQLVQAMSRAGHLSFFGSGGLGLADVESALQTLSKEEGIWGCNLLHNLHEPAVESATVDLLLRYGVRFVSASAFMTLSKDLVRYRVAGIYQENGAVKCPNHVFAKVSHPSVLQHFLNPPPLKYLEALQAEGFLTSEQVGYAQQIPMAQDITIESDSGGHTDGRPLMSIFPTYVLMRDAACKQHGYATPIRLGAAGGMGDPSAIRAAFYLGADYVLLGSVHQCTVEAGTSNEVKEMLAQATVIDCGQAMAPDMFEQGSHVQVLTKGTMYAQRSKRLYQLYRQYDSLDAIPDVETEKIERTIFRQPLDEVWTETEAYWQRDPEQLTRAYRDPKHKMALVFRWYLGQSSRWARSGDPERKRDYQIWCGPSIGAFNAWAAGGHFADWRNRHIVKVVEALWSAVTD